MSGTYIYMGQEALDNPERVPVDQVFRDWSCFTTPLSFLTWYLIRVADSSEMTCFKSDQGHSIFRLI